MTLNIDLLYIVYDYLRVDELSLYEEYTREYLIKRCRRPPNFYVGDVSTLSASDLDYIAGQVIFQSKIPLSSDQVVELPDYLRELVIMRVSSLNVVRQAIKREYVVHGDRTLLKIARNPEINSTLAYYLVWVGREYANVRLIQALIDNPFNVTYYMYFSLLIRPEYEVILIDVLLKYSVGTQCLYEMLGQYIAHGLVKLARLITDQVNPTVYWDEVVGRDKVNLEDPVGYAFTYAVELVPALINKRLFSRSRCHLRQCYVHHIDDTIAVMVRGNEEIFQKELQMEHNRYLNRAIADSLGGVEERYSAGIPQKHDLHSTGYQEYLLRFS